MTNCNLDTLALTEVPLFGLTVGDLCTVCHREGDARLKVTTFLPVGRNLALAGEYRSCPDCEALCIDAAHAGVAQESPRHLVRTLALHGHPDHYAGREQKGKLNPSGVVIAKRVICDTSARAAA